MILKMQRLLKILLIIELKCAPQLLKENGPANLKINKKKFIYLISPNKVTNSFYNNLKLILKTRKVSFFQLRLKSYSLNKKMIIGEKIKNICKKNKVKFIINDDPLLALKLNADGCHLGQKDMDINFARQILGNCLLYTSPSPRDGLLSRMPSSA